MYTLEVLQTKTLKDLKEIGQQLNVLPEDDRRLRQTWIDAIAGVNPPLLKLLEVSPAAEVQAQESPIIETVEASPAAEDVQAQEPPLESKFGRIVYPRPAQGAISPVAKTSPGVEVEQVQGAISQAVENSPGTVPPTEPPVENPLNDAPKCPECFDDGYIENEFGRITPCHQCNKEPKLSRQKTQKAIVPAAKNLPGSRSKTSTAHQLLELFQSSAHIIEDSPGVKTEATVSESAIAPATKNHIEEESDQNPILTGIFLSDRFLARYSPPQPENIRFQLEADGQLSLLDFEIESQPEPPDPDDFGSIDAFQEALARWDAENAEMLADIDSMCEWAPCPEEWYEPEAKNLPLRAPSTIELSEQSEVMELSIDGGSSITCNFSIPTFGAWCDRSSDADEPPDTGIFARLPGPKPPKFPPRASQPKSAQVRQAASRNYPETIPKLFHCVAAGSSTQPARSPPGGDA